MTPPGRAPGTSARASGWRSDADSERALEVMLARLMQLEGRQALPAIRVASGTALGGAETWCVAQVLLREKHGVPADLDTIAASTTVPASVLLPAFELTRSAGYLTGDPAGWHATEEAHRQWEVFVSELKSWLLERLRTTPDSEAEDARLLDQALAPPGQPAPLRGDRVDPACPGPRPGGLSGPPGRDLPPGPGVC